VVAQGARLPDRVGGSAGGAVLEFAGWHSRELTTRRASFPRPAPFARRLAFGAGGLVGWQDVLTHPGAEGPPQPRLVLGVTLAEEPQQLLPRQVGEGVAALLDRVFSRWPEVMKAERLAIEAPDLLDAQRGVDGQAVERVVGEVHLDGKVRGWVGRH